MLSKLYPALAALILISFSAVAQTPTPQLPFDTDGPVNSIIREGNTIYIGGEFRTAGKPTGHGAAVNVANGSLAATDFPYIDKEISASVPDGQGGWYIAGDFQYIGRTYRPNFAHLFADLSPDPDFNPDNSALTGLSSLVLCGSKLLYCAYGSPRAVNAKTGESLPWHPDVQGGVNQIAASGSTVYIAGSFSSVNNISRLNIAALDTLTGAVKPWSPPVGLAGDGSYVSQMDIRKGKVYIAGSFSRAAGSPRNNLAALDSASGAATAWNPNSDEAILIMSLGEHSAYIYGYYSYLNGIPYEGMANVDFETGRIKRWHPTDNGTNYITGIREYRGIAYITTRPVGFPSYSKYLSLTDTLRGRTAGPEIDINGQVYTLSFQDGKLFAGGNFNGCQLPLRRGLAAFEANTGNLLPWNPNTTGFVNKILLHDGKIFACGTFDSAGGESRNRVAAFDANTAALSPFAPFIAAQQVNSIHIVGNKLFASGTFGGQDNPTGLLTFDKNTGELSPLQINPGSSVATMQSAGNTLFLSGRFDYSEPGTGQTRADWAAFNVETGRLTNFNPRPIFRMAELCLIGGVLYGISSEARASVDSYYGAYDTATGAPIACNFEPESGGALCNAGGKIVVAAYYSLSGSTAEYRLQIANPENCTSLDVNSNLRDHYFISLAGYGKLLYGGGGFNYWDLGNDRKFFMLLDNQYGEDPLGIAEPAHTSATTTLYPNPATDKLFIASASTGTASAKAFRPVIFNAIGQSQNLLINPHADGWETNVSALPAGVYFVQTGQGTHKFIKE